MPKPERTSYRHRLRDGTKAARLRTAAALVLVAVIVGLTAVATGERPASAAGPDAGGVVLLELFTSQGCSSCPPADRLLSRLAQREDIVALAYHVDYWNYIGWTDPFSSQEWSARQRIYRESFGLASIYTPQVVIDGRFEGVGADAREVNRLLERARRGAESVELGIRRAASGDPKVEIEISTRSGDARLGVGALMLAVTESGLTTEVSRGENGGRSLVNDNVVRSLRQVAQVDLDAARPQLFTAPVALPPSGTVRVVAFLQQAETMAVLAAVQLDGSAFR